jgi:hypothetical protein
MPHKPADEQQDVGRVSPTAPPSKSTSTNVWRLLESNTAFRDGMGQAADDFDKGRVGPTREFLKRPR